MSYQLIVIPIISALIGYVTNVVAIKMLFWPRKPIDLGSYQFQGLLPKRKQEIAASLGQLVEKELLDLSDVLDMMDTPEVHNRIISRLCKVVRDRLVETLPSFTPAKLTQIVADIIEKILRQEYPAFKHQLFAAGKEYLTEEIRVSKIVEDKINAFDLQELEYIIKKLSITELTFIEVLGGVMGFIIGIVQVVIIWFLPGN
jgi:uncharacterized membrane protein YheB (UPF0754 family)